MPLMESFQFLVDNIPQWIDKLELLAQQVAERQAEFNRLSQATGGLTPMIRKNKTGSTESLKAKGNEDESDGLAGQPDTSMPPPSTPTTPQLKMEINPNNKRLFQEHRDHARRKRKSASVLSGASGPQRYRSRMSLIIYYDSNIQEGFEWLVRGVSSARNTLRKGKITASYKARMASLHVEESPFDGDRTDLTVRNPKVPRFTRSTTPFSVDSLALEQFETIDKDLETAQTLCEVGAHQFLRDADCNDELATTKEHLNNSLRVAREQVEALKAEEEEKKLLQQDGGDRQNPWPQPSERAEETEINGDATSSYIGGANGFRIEIYDGHNTATEIDSDDHATNTHAKGIGTIEIDDNANKAGNIAIDDGMIDVDDSEQRPNGEGLGDGMIEIDDGSNNDEIEIDMATFLRNRRAR